MTIKAHSLLARFYAGRPPYSPVFFQVAMRKLGISGDSVLMDLCCGRGELSAGFSAACKAIYAVDGSKAMLDHAIRSPNVTYLLNDVNKDVVALPRPVDHIMVGTAIHWVEPARLRLLVENNLKPGGKVLVSHTLLKLKDQPWFPALAQLDASFGRDGRGAKSFKDLEGVQRLAACNFERVDGLRVVTRLRFDVAYLYKSQLSYLYDTFYERVSADLEGYRRRLFDAVTPYLDSEGMLEAALVNWGVVFAEAGERRHGVSDTR